MARSQKGGASAPPLTPREGAAELLELAQGLSAQALESGDSAFIARAKAAEREAEALTVLLQVPRAVLREEEEARKRREG